MELLKSTSTCYFSKFDNGSVLPFFGRTFAIMVLKIVAAHSTTNLMTSSNLDKDEGTRVNSEEPSSSDADECFFRFRASSAVAGLQHS